jgi:iron-sulfur cluster insertion protein
MTRPAPVAGAPEGRGELISQEVSMITLTEMAVKKVQDLRLEEAKPDWGLRLRVVGGGCSGFSYELGWEDAEQEGDQIMESRGVKVFVDPMSTEYVSGIEIDYVDSLYGSGFSVKNPNAKGTCGCGHSFQA